MGSNNSISILTKVATRLQEKRDVYANSPDSTDVVALQDWYKTSATKGGKVLRCKSGAHGKYHVSQSPKSLVMDGLYQLFKDWGGKDEKRFTRRLQVAVSELLEVFPDQEELKGAAESLNRMAKLGDGALRRTAEFEHCLDVAAAAKRILDDSRSKVAAMREKRSQLQAQSSEAFEATLRARGEDPARCARNAKALETVYFTALNERLDPQDGKSSLRRFVLGQSMQADQSPVAFLEGLLLKNNTSYALAEPVFKALVALYQELRTESVHQLTPRVMVRDQVDIELLGRFLNQSVPTGKRIDWGGARPAGLSVQDAERLFATKLNAALDRVGHREMATGKPDRLKRKAEAVKAHCQDGVFHDTVAFRQAVQSLLKAQREELVKAQAKQLEEELQATQDDAMDVVAGSADLEQQVERMEQRYLDHLQPLMNMNEAQLKERYGKRSIEASSGLVEQLNAAFAPEDAGDEEYEVDPEQLARFFMGKGQDPGVVARRLLLQSAVPAYIHASVVQALIELAIQSELLEQARTRV